MADVSAVEHATKIQELCSLFTILYSLCSVFIRATFLVVSFVLLDGLHLSWLMARPAH